MVTLADWLAQYLWYGILFTPISTLVLIYKWRTMRFVFRLLMGLLVMLLLAGLLYIFAMALFFRNGMGA